MRPVKQAGVISTHTVLYFAPAAASTGSGAALLLLHVSREGFFFISACMLTYAYAGLNRAGLRRFYWRRFCRREFPTCAGVSSISSTLCQHRTTLA
jgi:peptidoglycan/LPS O-acetylase OafA/YrhL